ncbi:MAG: 50S ribosomal protein L25 [Deltaproteobacteria bacterium]|nr:50S ribosomal protein L25 [Deltaproteobacteria bacterium]
MSKLVLEVEKREEKGSNASRRIRARGDVPAVVFGGGIDSVPIVVNRKKVIELLQGSAGGNTIFLLKVGKDERHAMIREMQVDPMRGQIEHIDFQRIVMTEKIQVDVPIELEGTPVGVRIDQGILDFVSREVAVTCLPGDIPTSFTLDVSDLKIGQHLEAKDLDIPENVELIDDPIRLIVSVAAPRLVEEEEETEEDLLEAGTAEPEVVGKTAEEEDS